MKRLRKGQVLEVLTDYDGALEDIPGWCKRCGHQFIGAEEAQDCYKAYIKKVKGSLLSKINPKPRFWIHNYWIFLNAV